MQEVNKAKSRINDKRNRKKNCFSKIEKEKSGLNNSKWNMKGKRKRKKKKDPSYYLLLKR